MKGFILLAKARATCGTVDLGFYKTKGEAEAAWAFVWTLLAFHKDHDMYLSIESGEC